MDNRQRARNLFFGAPDAEAAIAGLLDQLDVYRLALALACGEEEYPRNLAPAYVCEDSVADTIAMAQDELRHGRRPEWLDKGGE